MLFRNAQLDRIERLLADIHTHVKRMETTTMTLVSEVKESMAAALAASNKNTNATAAVAQAVEALKAAVVTANEALANYIATHPTDADLTEIKAGFDAITANTDADTIAEEALANTPAAPDA